jgi:hypothetical protein
MKKLTLTINSQVFDIISRFFNHTFGENFSVLQYFKELEIVKSPLYDPLDSNIIYERYPHVRFLWFEMFGERCLTGKKQTEEEIKVRRGAYYEGRFERDEGGFYQGKGVLSINNMMNSKYEGVFKGNFLERRGVHTCNYGRYEGEFKAFDFEGKGTFIHKSGDKYEGEWKESKQDGVGTMFYNNGLNIGQRYEGEWKSGARVFGTYFFYFDNEEERYVGEWKNDEMTGIGTYFYSSGKRFEGEWKKSLRDGRGIKFFPNGERCEGEWKNDMREGRFIKYNAEGIQYEGVFEEGELIEEWKQIV